MELTGIDTSSSGIGDLSLDGLDISSADPSDTSVTSSSCTDTADNSVSAVSIANADGTAKTSSIPKAESVELETLSGLDLQNYQAQQKEIPIAQLLQRTGYSIVQANGQRHYGPPPNWQGPAPQRGCEVFVGKIPRDCFEDELVPVFENVGKIYEMRLMLDHFSGQNRGYCFVVFSSAMEAKQCVRLLNNYEVRKGRSLGICMSVDNCRLFVGGIPKKVTKEDIIIEMQKVTDAVVDVIVYPSASDKSKNRGFAFVEYETHRAAAVARRKLINGRVDLWGHNIAVDWAEPELEVDAEIMAQVKVLYVRNLMLSTSEAQILELFRAYGNVERVKKIKDYAFVHFQLREEAQKAMEAMNGAMLDGAQVEVTLAKPVDRESYLRSQKLKPTYNMPAFYIPVDQYGTIMSLYPNYISPQLPSQRFMLRNSMGACMPPASRMPRSPSLGMRGPMLYPLTFPTSPCLPQPHLIYPTNPIRTGGQIPSFYSAPLPHNTFYEPSMSMTKHLNEQQEFPTSPPLSAAGPRPPATTLPAMLEVTSTGTSSIKSSKTCALLLEEICQRNNWGSPMYSLHTSTNPMASGETDTLFLYKVTLVSLGLTYVPSKMSRNLAEAREMAAENALMQLGCPVEATTGCMAPPRSLPLQYSSEVHHLPAALCPTGFMGINAAVTSKPVCSWTPSISPMDYTAASSATFYANFTEGPFPMAQSYPPEYYQPSF